MEVREQSSLICLCLTDTTMNDAIAGAIPQETTGIPAQGLQAVPVYQGLTPKKPVIEEGTYSMIVRKTLVMTARLLEKC